MTCCLIIAYYFTLLQARVIFDTIVVVVFKLQIVSRLELECLVSLRILQSRNASQTHLMIFVAASVWATLADLVHNILFWAAPTATLLWCVLIYHILADLYLAFRQLYWMLDFMLAWHLKLVKRTFLWWGILLVLACIWRQIDQTLVATISHTVIALLVAACQYSSWVSFDCQSGFTCILL